MRGAVWTHSAYIEHTSIPFNEVVELRAKYVFSRWDGINIGGIDIFGEAIDDLFFIDNTVQPVKSKNSLKDSELNIIETWSATFRDRPLQILLLFENTLSFRGRNNLEFHPIIRIVLPGQEDLELLSGIYESILNFIRLIRYRVTCGSIETKLLDSSESHFRIGAMLTEEATPPFRTRYAMARLSFWSPYIQQLLQFVFTIKT